MSKSIQELEFDLSTAKFQHEKAEEMIKHAKKWQRAHITKMVAIGVISIGLIALFSIKMPALFGLILIMGGAGIAFENWSYRDAGGPDALKVAMDYEMKASLEVEKATTKRNHALIYGT